MARDPTSNVEQIREIVKFMAHVDAHLPLCFGSPLRVGNYALPNWGISVDSGNYEWIAKHSSVAYKSEWTDNGPEVNSLIANASQRAGLLLDANSIMNEEIGLQAANFLSDKIPTSTSKIIRIMDIGSGAGATTLALLNYFPCLDFSSLLDFHRSKIKFLLVEPSRKRIDAAKENINKKLEALSSEDVPVEKFEFEYRQDRDINTLYSPHADSADLIISNAALHHTSDYANVYSLGRKINYDGQLIIGDWHNTMWEHPAYAYLMIRILENLEKHISNTIFMQALLGFRTPTLLHSESELAREFRNFFNLADIAHEIPKGLNQDQMRANAAIATFWFEVARLFADKEEKPPILMLEGHQSVNRRLKILSSANFGLIENGPQYENPRLVLKNKGQGEIAAVMRLKPLSKHC